MTKNYHAHTLQNYYKISFCINISVPPLARLYRLYLSVVGELMVFMPNRYVQSVTFNDSIYHHLNK